MQHRCKNRKLIQLNAPTLKKMLYYFLQGQGSWVLSIHKAFIPDLLFSVNTGPG